MNVRVDRLRNLLLLIAIFSTIVVVGCWDNRRDMQRVFDNGYPATVQITGAQQQRLTPFAFDGWRPRFVEQELSVNLKWEGKDGKQHEQNNVPVTEGFAGTIVSGEQVRTAILPAKVVDDGSALPAINADAAARYTSLQSWLMVSSYLALVGWAGFAGITVWRQRGGSRRMVGSTPATAAAVSGWPPGRTLFGITALILGALLLFRFWVPEAPTDAGPEITADVSPSPVAPAGSHSLRLSWKDSRGGVHHYGPVAVSPDYWAKISHDGALTVQQVRIRYREDDPQARPVLVDDEVARPWQSKVGIASGVALLLAGAASLLSATRAVRQRPDR